MKGSVLAVLLVFAGVADARAAFETRRGGPGAPVFVRNYDEGRFTLDEIGVDASGWPEIRFHGEYRSAADAERAARRAGFFSFAATPLFEKTEAQAIELRDGATKPLWEAKNAWTPAWETKYAEWIEKNIDKDFFVRTHQASDCADLAYTARWIFARENALPVANRVSGTGDFFTERSVKKEWMKLPTNPDWSKDQRFRAALDYLLSLTYTHTLMEDSYPVALDPRTFRAGVHHLSLTEDTGHTLLIHRTDYRTPGNLPFLVLYSTLPVAVRTLAEQAYFYTDPPTPDSGGFLRMRWPLEGGAGVVLKPATEMPDYSLEQYDPKLMDGQSSFGLAVMRKLKPSFSLVVAIRSAIDGVKEMIQDRIGIVEAGAAFCAKAPGGCPPGSAGYEDWSTPSRDARLLAQAKLVLSMPSLGNSDERYRMEALVKEELKKPALELGGEAIALNLVVEAFRRGLPSADPNRSVEFRWAVRPEAYVDLFTERFVSGFAERKQRLATAGTACRSNPSRADCAIGGATYLKENSFAVDAKLKEPSLLATAYCRATGETDPKCARLRKLLAGTNVAIDDETKSLAEWADRALRLNSDPRVPLAAREGTAPFPYAMLEITGAHEFRVRGALAFARPRGGGGGTLYARGAAGFVPHAFPPGLAILDADLDANRGLFARGKSLIAADLAGAGETRIADLPAPIAEARFLGRATAGRERILAFTADEWCLLESGGSTGWSEVLRGRYREKAAIDSTFARDVLVVHADLDPTEGWSAVDLRAEHPTELALDGAPSASSARPDFVRPNAIYLQLTRYEAAGPSLRTFRIDRKTGRGGLAWGVRGYVGHVTGDGTVAYFGDKDGEAEAFYEARILPDGSLGPRTKLSTSLYRQWDYIIFYGGIPNMLFRAIGADGKLVPISLQGSEAWFKHVRGDTIFALLKDGDYGIRRVSGGGVILADGFLAMPIAGSREPPYRFMVRHWRSADDGAPVPASFASLTDANHPERGAILTGDLLGDPLASSHEPWDADNYVGVDSVDIDAGAVVNLGGRAFWIGDCPN